MNKNLSNETTLTELEQALDYLAYERDQKIQVQINKLQKESTGSWHKTVEEKFENTLRTSQNLAYNMVGFRLAMEMLEVKGVITIEIKDALIKEYFKHLKSMMIVLDHVKSKKGGEVFLAGLREIIEDGAHYYIENLPEEKDNPRDHKNAKPLGFCRDQEPDFIYIHPQTAHAEVSNLLGKSKSYLQGKIKTARELVAAGHIPNDRYDPSSPGFTKQLPGPMGNRPHMWCIKRESLGFPSRSKAVENPKTDGAVDNSGGGC